jgi:ferric-dicitrate binding protein FerR (iron transport regulator)
MMPTENMNPDDLERKLTEEGWEEFNTNERLSTPLSDKMLATIESNTYRRHKRLNPYYRWTAAAAAVILLVGGYRLLTVRQPSATSQPIATAPGTSPAPQWKEEENHTARTRKIALNDGSEIELAPKAQLRYAENFAPGRRDLYLRGSALFKVGKDPVRPFTVYIKDAHVTALGTTFRIVESPSKEEVQLLSGRVVIRPDSALKKRGIPDTYLEPGQSLLLDQNKFTASVIRSQKTDATPAAAPARTYTFDNQLLTDIFRQLSVDYQVKIIYKAGQLQDMTFTGKLNNKKETLDSFLHTIAALNGLTISRDKNSAYIIQ